MRTREEIENRIREIEQDSRYRAPLALVSINAPLALIQISMSAELHALK